MLEEEDIQRPVTQLDHLLDGAPTSIRVKRVKLCLKTGSVQVQFR